MALITVHEIGEPIIRPTVIAAFDGWVDAGGAATAAATRLAASTELVATFDADSIFDYRARRPTLLIEHGRPSNLTWSSLTLRRKRVGSRDILVLAGAEPDYHWRQLIAETADLLASFGTQTWISLGSIPAAVPHTRPVTVLGTESVPGLLRGNVTAGPAGTLKVPAALLSVLEKEMAERGIPAIGYFVQVPHYVSGPYPAAAVELIRLAGLHMDEPTDPGHLAAEALALRTRLDEVTAADEDTRGYVGRLEQAADESRLPAGDDLISDIERFLRDRSGGQS
jgi:hypothetical protein